VTEKFLSDVSENARTAIWNHYYQEEKPSSTKGKKKLRRITKKEIIVRTLKRRAPQGETVRLQDIAKMTGLSAHDLSGHLTHLVNEGKVERRGRGLFAVRGHVGEGLNPRIELSSLVKELARGGAPGQIEEKIVINNRDHSESRRMMLDFVNDMLLSCSEVDVSIRCKKDEKKKSGKIEIELRAH